MTEHGDTVICTYRVKPDKESQFIEVLKRHWPTLDKLGLVRGEPSRFYRGLDKDGRPFFVEIFTWRDAKAVETAHEDPEVMSVWEPMGAMCEERNGRPAMEFPHVEPFTIKLAKR
jgi:hypothetical protein